MAVPSNAALSEAIGPQFPPLLQKSFGSLLRQKAAQHPHQPFVVAQHTSSISTYADINRRSDELANGLYKLGLRSGDRCAILMGSQVEYVEVFFACAKLGAWITLCNYAATIHEIVAVLKQISCSMLIMPPRVGHHNYESWLGTLHFEIPSMKEVIVANPCSGTKEFAIPASCRRYEDVVKSGQQAVVDLLAIDRDIQPTDVFNIQFTSGSTGLPKPSALTHIGIMNVGYFIGKSLQVQAGDALCLPVPLFHSFGLIMGLATIVTSSMTMVLPAEMFDVIATLKAVQDFKCRGLYGVTTMFTSEIEHPLRKEFDLTSLRYGIMAGSALPPPLLARIREHLHIQDIRTCWGFTESSSVATMTTANDPPSKFFSTAGRLQPHVRGKVVRPGTTQAVPIGERGELCLSGYSVQREYYLRPEKTAEDMRLHGCGRLYIHTGDEGFLDGDGYWTVTGRIKDMIIRGGENITPAEIEQRLLEHPAIAQSAVIGVPDERYGEVIAAFLEMREGVAQPSDDHIRDFVRAKLARFKAPKFIWRLGERGVFDTWPKTGSGKIRKPDLREIAKGYLTSLALFTTGKWCIPDRSLEHFKSSTQFPGLALDHLATPSTSSMSDGGTAISKKRKRDTEKLKRTKTGCLTCRRRRVRCDEKQPKCTACARLSKECHYPAADDCGRRQSKKDRGAATKNLQKSMEAEQRDHTDACLPDLSDPLASIFGNRELDEAVLQNLANVPPVVDEPLVAGTDTIARESGANITLLPARTTSFNTPVPGPSLSLPQQSNMSMTLESGSYQEEQFATSAAEVEGAKDFGWASDAFDSTWDFQLPVHDETFAQSLFPTPSSPITWSPLIPHSNVDVRTCRAQSRNGLVNLFGDLQGYLRTGFTRPNSPAPFSFTPPRVPSPPPALSQIIQMPSSCSMDNSASDPAPPKNSLYLATASTSLISKKAFLHEYFLAADLLPDACAEDREWNQIRKVLCEMARDHHMVSDAICALSELHMAQNRGDTAHLAQAFLNSATREVELRLKYEADHLGEEFLATIFVLSLLELILNAGNQLFNLDWGTPFLKNGNRALTQVAKRLITWLTLLDSNLVVLGRRGILAQSSVDSVHSFVSDQAATLQHGSGGGAWIEDENRLDVAATLLETFNSSAYSFYLESHKFSRRIVIHDRHHRPRDTPEADSEVRGIGHVIFKELDELWGRRSKFMELPFSDLKEHLSAPLASQLRMNCLLYMAVHLAHYPYLHRCAFWEDKHTPRVSEALRQLFDIFVQATMLERDFISAFLWPLYMFVVEETSATKRQWVLGLLETKVSSKAKNTAKVKVLLEEQVRRQEKEGKRIDGRYLQMELFNTTFPII